jgi:hypothetical protein
LPTLCDPSRVESLLASLFRGYRWRSTPYASS